MSQLIHLQKKNLERQKNNETKSLVVPKQRDWRLKG